MSSVQHIVSNLPLQPGVYQFYDKEGVILYIGKAKNLRNRVSSYFNKQKYESYKTKRLSVQVADIKHIVVQTESDALLLENNLIKQYQPKYNILLKDDKTFPWICIKKEEFPRIFSIRNRVNDGSEYYGPYTSALMVRTLLNLVRQIYQIRTCNYKLSDENIQQGKHSVCLEYHIGNCLGACEGLQSAQEYDQTILQVRNILKGDIQQVQNYLHNLMLELSTKQKFEEAEKIKQKYVLLQKFKSKSTIVNPKINNVDVFCLHERKNKFYVNFLKIIQGAIVQSHCVEVIRKLDETKEEILTYAILDIRDKVHSNSPIIYTQFQVSGLNNINVIVPKIGDKKKLLDLSERNALQYALHSEKKSTSISEKFTKPSENLLRLQTDLRLKEIPVHIECFDNSNIQGTSPVAACVVFINGKPAPKEYRHFHIKTVEGANDFASMEEVIYRRYKRMLEEKQNLPQLIIIDGGKGQLGSAVNSLEKLNLYGKIAVLGIAKKLEELYFPGDSIPLYLDKNSSSLKIIQHLRNEAHRFGITFHRNVRSKKMLSSKLEEISGVGKKILEKLIIEFGSVDDLKNLSIEELTNVVSKSIAKKIWDYFNMNN